MPSPLSGFFCTHAGAVFGLGACAFALQRVLQLLNARGSSSEVRVLHGLLDTAEPKLPRMRRHDLRHSAASLLIASGVELTEVSMLLGHSELRVTMYFYAHLQKQTAAKAAKKMDTRFLDSVRQIGRLVVER